MARGLDIERWKDELVTAYRFGEEDRVRVLVRQPGPRKARALLESMLEADTGRVRQAAAFGHVLPRLPEPSRATLHAVTRRGVASSSLSCALRAASLLEFVGQPQDVPLLEAHRPEDATFAAVFDEVAQALRRRQ